MGRTAVGVIGLRLREGDRVIGAGTSARGGSVLTVTENGFGKQTPLEEYRLCHRGGLGVRNCVVNEKTGPVIGMLLTDGTGDLLIITDDGVMIRIPETSVRICGRASQGVRVMRPAPGSKVVCIEKTSREDTETPQEQDPELPQSPQELQAGTVPETPSFTE